MSAITFHSPSGHARVRGSEHAYATLVMEGVTRSVLTLAVDSQPPLTSPYGPGPRLDPAPHPDMPLPLAWSRVLWRDHTLPGLDLAANTAIALGSDPVRLLVRLATQSELHAWVDGPDRAWLADIIDDGLHQAILRAGAGWDDVTTLLRSTDTEPVVTSHSASSTFPNAHVAQWIDDDPDSNTWWAMPEDTRWDLAMRALRAQDYGPQLSPTTFATYRFGNCLTVMDLTADNHIERLEHALT